MSGPVKVKVRRPDGLVLARTGWSPLAVHAASPFRSRAVCGARIEASAHEVLLGRPCAVCFPERGGSR